MILRKYPRRLIFAIALVFRAVLLPAEEDPFGDPFDDAEIVVPSEAEPVPVLPAVVVEIGGELIYQPTMFLDYTGDEFADPVFLSNVVTAKLNITSRFDRSHFLAGFRTSVTTSTENQPDIGIGIDELYFNHRTNYTDVTVGYFELDWSPMNVFKLTDVFTPSPLLLIDRETQSRAVTGLHAILYLGFLSIEGVFAPLYHAPDGLNDLAGSVGINLYPADIPVEFTDTRPGLVWDNPQAAVRLGLGTSLFDAYLIYFHGFTNRVLNTSKTVFEPPAAVTLQINTEYETVNAIGAIATFEILNIIVNAETVFTLEAPVLVNETVDLPIGTVTNKVLGYAPLLRWSAGFDWEVFKNIRLLFEYTDLHLLEELDGVDESLLGGDTFFGTIDIRLPMGMIEPAFTAGALYDWSGHDFTVLGTLGVDFLNGFVLEVSGIYFDIFDSTDRTSPMYEQLENDVILNLNARYSF